jgi:hypothetical protein
MTASAAKSVVAAMIERPEKWHFLMKKWHTTYDRRHNTATIKRKGPKINKAFTIINATILVLSFVGHGTA